MSDRVFSWKTWKGTALVRRRQKTEMVLWQHSDVFSAISVKWLKLNPLAFFPPGTVKLSYTISYIQFILLITDSLVTRIIQNHYSLCLYYISITPL